MTTRLIERPKAVDKEDPRYFEFRTVATRAYTTGSGDQTRYFITGTASSNTEDRYGDTLDDACQKSMRKQAEGLTMWLNHSYKVPEDIAGTCLNPTLKDATADDGTKCIDLEITLEIDPGNPRALKCWEHVNRGTRLAFSIGGYFVDFDWVDEDDWFNWSVIVHDIELLEISLVGIPANRRAYTKNFGISMDRLKAEIVRRAEDIAKEARDGVAPDRAAVREIVRKSFGLKAEKGTGTGMSCKMAGCTDAAVEDSARGFCAVHDQACAHKDGCSERRAADSMLCTTHRDAVPIARDAETVNAQLAAAGGGIAPTDSPAARATTTKTFMLTLALNADTTALRAELAKLQTELREAEDGIVVDVQSALERVAQLGAEIQQLQTQRDALVTERDQVSSEVATLTATKDDLEKQVAALKATPTGRSTQSSYAGGSTRGSEPYAPPELYNKSQTELTRQMARSQDESSDARSRAY